jgi:hypothetical protein
MVRGSISSEHLVQFFDTVETLADSVGAFLAEGYEQGETLLVLVKPINWEAISARLLQAGCNLSSALASSRLMVRDANLTLQEFMRNGLPDSILFHRVVGDIVRDRAKQPGGFRIYGEMVEILAEEANFHAAQRLEELWNELAVRNSFVLMCGYSAVHFAAHDRQALAGVCAAHTHVHTDPADQLAHWLITSNAAASKSPPPPAAVS